MKNFQEVSQLNSHSSPSKSVPQRDLGFVHNKQNIFSFLKSAKNPLRHSSFFSHNGLGQDIIQVTEAEPDVCLEVFYALYHVLWPQLEKLNKRKKLGKEENQLIISLQDAWKNVIGGSSFKGILWSPEKLLGSPQEVKTGLSENEGENDVFTHLDAVMWSIANLQKKLKDYPGDIDQREEILASLELIQDFYTGFRRRVRDLVAMILENNDPLANYHALENLLEPKAVMMSDIFEHHWAYRIPRKKAQKLLSLDKWRDHMKNYSNEGSIHRVSALPEKKEAAEPLVYFKANGGTAIQPEKEFMLYSLYRHLQIPVPETALLILTDVFAEDPNYYYAVQASEAVIGESALEACRNQETVFEDKAYVEQVIGALLTNPSDGSLKNFKYCSKKKTLVCIDNDLVFKPELGGNDDKTVNVRSILYLLPQMDLAIPDSTKTFFTSLDPHLTILSWLIDLSKKNSEYSLLFSRLVFQKTRSVYQSLLPQNEIPPLAECFGQKVLVDSVLQNDSFYPQILVSKNLLRDVSEKLEIIEKTLLNNPSASTQILFEEISPVVGKYYRKLRLEFNDPKEALDALWGEKKENGVDYSKISSLLTPEELSSFSCKTSVLDEKQTPDMFVGEYKNKFVSERRPPLDRFIQRHSQRKRKNILNLNLALAELRLLIQEGLTDSRSPRDIVDFCYHLTRVTEADLHLIKEITSLLSSLPSTELKWLFTLEKYFKRADCDVPENLKQSSVSVTGAFIKERTFALAESEKLFLFDQQGNLQRSSSLTGRSNVTCFPGENPEFYLKQYPEFPGYELASTIFMRELGIKYLPYHDLVIIDNSYPVLISQKVSGSPVHQIWANSLAFSNLDPVQTGLLIVAAMLLNPEDGKEDNWVLSENGKFLIPIDNDHCFLPSTFQKEGNFWSRGAITGLQTKTLLFCLQEMKRPIPVQVRKEILEVNFDLMLTSWLTELEKLETRLNNLANQEQRTQFLEQGTVMRIPFYKQFIYNLHWKAHKIQSILENNTHDPTPFDLLKAIEPFAARCYESSFQPGYDLQMRFKAATEQLYKKTTVDGSRFSAINTRIMIEIINIPKKDLQNDVVFQKMGPVDVAELLKVLIRERRERARKEQEILCELDEKSEEKKWVGLFGKPPTEAALEDFFTNPKEGLVLKGSKLVVSSKLTALFALTPDQGKNMRFLSLENSPLLTHRTIRTLARGCPNLEYLNVSGCVKLEEIFTAKGEWPLLARLEAKDCLKLERFVSFSPVKVLRIGTEKKIEILAEKSTIDILMISFRANYSDLVVKKGENFEIKLLSQSMSTDDFILNLLRGKDDFNPLSAERTNIN